MIINRFIKLSVLLILSVVFITTVQAQEPTFGRYGNIDRQVKRAPDSLSNNIIHLHRYLEALGTEDHEKIRAFYMWIIKNIKYEDQVELLYDDDILFYMGSNNCASPVCVLKKKKAVCEGFSKLFQFFCQQSGIEAYSIGGYISKKGEFQDRATHSWNVAKINNEWRFFDLSWANARLEHTGIRQSTNEFFMVDPHEFILSHLPLVPMWQFLETPISITIFNLGDEYINQYLVKKKPDYNYADSLKAYKQLHSAERSIKTAHDIYLANPSNKFNRAIEYYRYSRIVLSYQSSLEKKDMRQLIKAKNRIRIAMILFRKTQDVGSQLLFLQAQDDLVILNEWIKITKDQNRKKSKP